MFELLRYPPGPEPPFESQHMHLPQKLHKQCVAFEVEITGSATLSVVEYARKESEHGYPVAVVSTEKPNVYVSTIRNSGIYQTELGPCDCLAVRLETYSDGEVIVHGRLCLS